MDIGDPEFVPAALETDADGNARVWDGNGDGLRRVDLGALEYGAFTFGDLNCDAQIDGFDIDAFVAVLLDDLGSYYAQHPDCDHMLADCNGDSRIDGFDIDPFIVLLCGG